LPGYTFSSYLSVEKISYSFCYCHFVVSVFGRINMNVYSLKLVGLIKVLYMHHSIHALLSFRLLCLLINLSLISCTIAHLGLSGSDMANRSILFHHYTVEKPKFCEHYLVTYFRHIRPNSTDAHPTHGHLLSGCCWAPWRLPYGSLRHCCNKCTLPNNITPRAYI